MRQVKRWRYYCDHCKKAGGRRNVIEKHERGCTNNPNRVCAMHQFVTGCPALATTAELTAELETKGYRALRELAEQCPACILAATRQSKTWGLGLTPGGLYEGLPDFDFKAEVEAMWADYRANEREQQSRSYCGDY